MAVTFRPATREAMAQNHSRWRATRRTPAPAALGSRLLNVQQVLDMGNVVYFTFRGRAYGIPPLGWRGGQELTLLWTEAVAYPSPLTPETAPAYYALIARLPGLLWKHCHPAGWLARRLHRLGLLRNPFRHATEGELVELAAFFQSRRSASSIGPGPATNQSPPTPTPSTSWTRSATSPRSSRAGSTPEESP